jgi:hypothetical protein
MRVRIEEKVEKLQRKGRFNTTITVLQNPNWANSSNLARNPSLRDDLVKPEQKNH